jgi:uncharacterized protein (TIGR03435 family)
MRIRRTVGLVIALALVALAADTPTFDVTSVKPSKADAQPNSNFPLGPGDVYIQNGGLFSATALPLSTYIVFAYRIIGNQAQYLLPQLPDWAKNEKYDIQARASGNPGKNEMRLLMRSLLADRFKLALHEETREVPVLGFVLAKPGRLGPNLKPHPDSYACETNTSVSQAAQNGADGLPALCNGIFGMAPSVPGRQRIGARNVKLAFLADALSLGSNLGRPMVNKTGLDEGFDFSLEWVPDRPGAQPAQGDAPETSGPTLQQALLDQFGIKLQSDKASINVYVLDHVERPSEN